MKNHINKTIAVIFALVGFISTFTLTVKAEALEPKLLWEKEFKGSITTRLAKESGDVIVYNSGPDVNLFDKNGNTRFKWGPRIDRIGYSPDISSDGSVLIFTSSWKKTYALKIKKKSTDERVHYLQRNGKELWTRLYPPIGYFDLDYYLGFYRAYLSPNGKYVAIVGHFDSEGGGEDIELWNSTGNKLWRYKADGVEEFQFSPDSKYLVAGYGGGGVTLLDLSGNAIYSDDINVKTMLTSTTVSENADYIATAGVRRTAIIDKQGDIVLDGGKGEHNLAFVNRRGTRGILWDENVLKIYNLPSKELLKSYPIRLVRNGVHKDKIDMSSDGRYIALTGKKIDLSSRSNIFVIDMDDGDKLWETEVADFYNIQVSITNDGKYVLIAINTTALKGLVYYYQI